MQLTKNHREISSTYLQKIRQQVLTKEQMFEINDELMTSFDLIIQHVCNTPECLEYLQKILADHTTSPHLIGPLFIWPTTGFGNAEMISDLHTRVTWLIANPSHEELRKDIQRSLATSCRPAIELIDHFCDMLNVFGTKDWKEHHTDMSARLRELRDRLVVAHLPLVLRWLRKFNYKVDWEDAIQFGNVGLILAAKRYRPTYREQIFATYAIPRISERINVGLRSVQTVALPYNRIVAEKIVRKMADENRDISEMVDKAKLGKKSIAEILSTDTDRPKISYVYIDDEDKQYNHHLVQTSDAIESRVLSSDQTKVLQTLLTRLTDKERDIIERRFGIGYEDPQILDQVAEIYNVSRERVRQIEAKALFKLSEVVRRNRLRGENYFDIPEAVHELV